MVFHLHRETFNRRVCARPLWNSPAFHYSVELEPQIEMKVTRSVLLDYEA
jgi:hypothetical protein